MRILRLVALSIAIWGLSLLWPEVNQILTPRVAIGMTIGLGTLVLAYIWTQRTDYHHNHNDAGQDHPSHPIPAVVPR
jgi:hypothetical protein